jgi:heat shock protein HslJ
MRIKTLFFGLAIAALTAAGCTSATGGSGGTLDGVTWALTSYLADGSLQTVPDDVLADATFTAADSTVSGSGGCNRFTGAYTQDGASLTFGPLASTQMACIGPASDVEAGYLANLEAAASFTATTEALTIFDESGATILEFVVAQPGELGGVTWLATGINNGRGGVESVVAGTEPTAVYDAAAGTVSGETGCNQFNGPAVVDGTAITIGPLVSTRMACVEEAANAQEAAYVAALEASTTWEVRGSTLELRDDSGALQVSFEAS